MLEVSPAGEGTLFERLTDSSRKVFGLARSAALKAGHDTIDAAHILFSLLDRQLQDCVGARVLKACGADPERLRSEVLRRMPPVPGRKVTGLVPFTPRAKSALEHALEEANAAGVSYITTEHLLLGLLHQDDGIVPELLQDLQSDLDGVRRRIADVLAEGAGHAELGDIPVRPPDRIEDLQLRIAELEARIRDLESRED